MKKRKIRGPSRSRVSIRPRAVRAALTAHYEAGLQEDLDWEIEPPTPRTASAGGS
jgi:hypothetical protein